MKQAKQKALLKNKTGLSKATLDKYRKTYTDIINKGLAINPLSNAPPLIGKRGRKAKSKPRNLLERLNSIITSLREI